jgi:hypothetical protein
MTSTLSETNRQKLARETVENGTCQWWLGCDLPATLTRDHFLLGAVPVCEAHVTDTYSD